MLIVRVLTHVPDARAALHPQRSAPTTVKVPLQIPQLISPDSSLLLGLRLTPATRSAVPSIDATAVQAA
ncbi:hypothetical protein U1737_20510 [Sphingomonas sp. LB3N6]|uniref:hypothetical protein n=1 Tax=Sphingomonas fucosidasi TaxID=3096164 RepID=UPI002FC71A14